MLKQRTIYGYNRNFRTGEFKIFGYDDSKCSRGFRVIEVQEVEGPTFKIGQTISLERFQEDEELINSLGDGPLIDEIDEIKLSPISEMIIYILLRGRKMIVHIIDIDEYNSV